MLRKIYVDYHTLSVIHDEIAQDGTVPAPGEKITVQGTACTVYSYTILTVPAGLIGTVVCVLDLTAARRAIGLVLPDVSAA